MRVRTLWPQLREASFSGPVIVSLADHPRPPFTGQAGPAAHAVGDVLADNWLLVEVGPAVQEVELRLLHDAGAGDFPSPSQWLGGALALGGTPVVEGRNLVAQLARPRGDHLGILG